MSNQRLINVIVDYIKNNLDKYTYALIDTLLIITFYNGTNTTQCEIIFDESKIKIYNSQNYVSILDSIFEYTDPTIFGDILTNITNIMNGKPLESSIITTVLYNDDDDDDY